MGETLRDDRQYRIEAKEGVEINEIEQKIIDDINNILGQLKKSDATFLNDLKDDGIANKAGYGQNTYKYNNETLKTENDKSADISGLDLTSTSSYYNIDGKPVLKTDVLKNLLNSDRIKYKELYNLGDFSSKEVENTDNKKKEIITQKEQINVINDKFFEDLTGTKKITTNVADLSNVSTEKLSEFYEKSPSSFIDFVYTIAVLQISSGNFNYKIENGKIVYEKSQDQLKAMININMKKICEDLQKKNGGFLEDNEIYTSANVVAMAVGDGPGSGTKGIFDLAFGQALFEYNENGSALNNYARNAYSIESNQFKLYPYGMDVSLTTIKDGKTINNFEDGGEPKIFIKTGGYEISFLIDKNQDGKTVMTIDNAEGLNKSVIDGVTILKDSKGNEVISFDDKGNFTTKDSNNLIAMEVGMYKDRDAYEEVQCNIITNGPVEYAPEYIAFNGDDLFDSGRLIKEDKKNVGTLKKIEKSIKRIPDTRFNENELVINAGVDNSNMPTVDIKLQGDMDNLDTAMKDKTFKTRNESKEEKELNYQELKSILKQKADSVGKDAGNKELLLGRALTFVKLATDARSDVVFDPYKFEFKQGLTPNKQSERFVEFQDANSIQTR